MTRADYHTHRAGYRNALGVIKRARLHDLMADGSNNVQRQREESTHAHLRMLARQHADQLPKGTDPLGFRAMHKQWAERRSRVEYRVRCRQHDADLRARSRTRYGAQLNYDNRLPPDDSMREAAIEALTEQLTADMWQDLEHLSDAINNAAYTIGHYRKKSGSHPMTVTFLTLLRDGSDDAELGRMLRLAAKDYISGMANDEAEERLGEGTPATP